MQLVIHPPVEDQRLTKCFAAAGQMAVVNAVDEAEAVKQIADAEAFHGKITPLATRHLDVLLDRLSRPVS